MTNELIVLLNGTVAGYFRQNLGGVYSFTYDETWIKGKDAYPISLSMPMSQSEYGDKVVRPYMAGLLPDNVQILAGWGRRYQVSARNPFALLAHTGEDCAGAIQIVLPEHVAELQKKSKPQIEWITEGEIAERLRTLSRDHAASRYMRDKGQFSLAGAQPKTAFFYEDGRWGVPAGRTPTTHIFKPPLSGYKGFAENEHICLRLAYQLGIPTAKSEVQRFEDQTTIVVERYDRVRAENEVIRVHQEDLCQALSVPPENKYESDRGPGPAGIIALLQTYSGNPDEDVTRFLDALVLNWVIYGTDAHAKNYSLLFQRGGSVRLAPLYDIVSALAYPQNLIRHKLKLAMKIGSDYKVNKIARRDWEKLAEKSNLDATALVDRARGLIQEIPDQIHDVIKLAELSGLTHTIFPTLETGIINNSKDCLRKLNAA